MGAGKATPAPGGGGGGALVSEDDQEEVQEGEAVSLEDYEAEALITEVIKEQQESDSHAADEGDYSDGATVGVAAAPKPAPAPALLDSYQVISEDKARVARQTQLSAWQWFAVLGLAFVLGISVFRFSNFAMKLYLEPRRPRPGSPSLNDAEIARGDAPGNGNGSGSGGGGAAGTRKQEVEAARERERLLNGGGGR